jgi:hypothetical protein
LKANVETTRLPWTTPLPIETHFTQLETDLVCSAVGTDPISAATTIRTGHNIIETTSLFNRLPRLAPNSRPTKCYRVPDLLSRCRSRSPSYLHARGCLLPRRLSGYSCSERAYQIPSRLAGYSSSVSVRSSHPAPARTPATYTYCWSHGNTMTA